MARVSKFIDSCFHLKQKMHAGNSHFLASEGNETECTFPHRDSESTSLCSSHFEHERIIGQKIIANYVRHKGKQQIEQLYSIHRTREERTGRFSQDVGMDGKSKS